MREIAALGNVKVMGLMTMGLAVGDPEDARPYFVETRKVFERLKALGLAGVTMQYLSMGMTNSYRVAIEEGDDAALAQKATDDVHAFLEKLKVNRILIYPLAHLSSNLAKPSQALKLIKAIGSILKTEENRDAPCSFRLEQAVHDLH